MPGLSCCVQAFSSCGEQGLLSSCVLGLLVAVASRCSGFSCCRAEALDAGASVVVSCGLISCGSRSLERIDFSSCVTRTQ